jgi:hypothetical protein
MVKRNDKVKMARPGEPEAVRTTIVGGRPPAGGADVGEIPRGVEVLIKKAAVDPAFKKILFERRAEAAKVIGLKLTATEQAMLAAVPEAQLRAIVANTKVSLGLRPAFLGYAAGAMLAALGVLTAGCDATFGNQPDRPGEPPAGPPGVFDPSENTSNLAEKENEPVARGIRPNRP